MQLGDSIPASGDACQALDQIARLFLSLLEGINGNHTGTCKGDVVNLASYGHVGANSIDVDSGAQPLTLQDRLASCGSGDHDVAKADGSFGALGRLDLQLELLAHLRAKLAAPCSIWG